MAQRTKRRLPQTVYATPGMLGIGDDGIVNESDKYCGGLQKVLVARTAIIDTLAAPSFIFLTNINRKKGGERGERGKFLLLAKLIVPGKPDVVGLFGVWLLSKTEYELFYPSATILAGDKASRATFKKISEHGLIIDLNWRHLGGLCEAEHLLMAARGGGAQQPTQTPLDAPSLPRCLLAHCILPHLRRQGSRTTRTTWWSRPSSSGASTARI